MFCSGTCLDKAMASSHECSCNRSNLSCQDTDFLVHGMIKCFKVFDWNVKKLEKLLMSTEKQPVTVFDFDFSDSEDPMYEQNMIRVMLSFPFEVPMALLRLVMVNAITQNQKLKKLWSRHKVLIEKLGSKLMAITSRTARQAWHSKYINIEACGIEGTGKIKDFKDATERFDVKTDYVGSAVYPLADSLRYSCDPNTNQVLVSNKIVTYVCKPIKKGSQLSRNVFSTFAENGPTEERRKLLSGFFNYHCDCEACVKDWPMLEAMRSADPLFKYPDIRAFAPHDQAKRNVARNNEYVNRNFKEHEPTQEVYITIKNNLVEMNGLTRPSFYP
jgi:hypothetical protein